MSLRRGARPSITAARGARRRGWWLAAVLAGALNVMLDDPAPAADEPVLVIMRNHQFEPKLTRVRPGQAIRFDNADDVLHSLLLVGHESVIGEEFVDPGWSYTVRMPRDITAGTTKEYRRPDLKRS